MDQKIKSYLSNKIYLFFITKKPQIFHKLYLGLSDFCMLLIF